MIVLKHQSDTIGALASTFCLVHCIATPFIFIAQSTALNCCEGAPVWWRFMDYFFLVISFIAVYKSTQNTFKSWVKPALWGSWFFLFAIIMNEKMAWFALNEKLIYFPAIALISLHLYNKRYCS